MRRKEKGTALMMAMVAILMLAGIAAALINTVSIRSRAADFRMEELRAVQVAEAAIERAISRMSTLGVANAAFGADFVTNPDIALDADTVFTVTTGGVIREAGEYFATVVQPDSVMYPDRFVIRATARLGDIVRAVEVTVDRKLNPLPSPFPQSGADMTGAMGMFGKVADKARLKLPGMEKDADDDGTKEGLTVFNGIDSSSQGNDASGIAVSDSPAFQKMVNDLIEKMADGKLPESIFQGDPVTEYTAEDGTTVNTSISISGDAPEIDPQALIDLANKIADGVRTDLIPNATLTITGNNVTISTDTVWGTSASDITVIDAKKLKLDGEGGSDITVSGTGTLVILGELEIRDANFIWDGDIIILGEDVDGKKRDSELKNKHGTLTVDGTITLLGSGKGKTSFKIEDEGKTDQSASSITGAILLLSGDEDKAKVEFKAKHGTLTIDGLLMMLGHQVKLDLKPENKNSRQGSFTLNGGLILGVGEFADAGKKKKSKLEVKIKGDVTIQLNSDKIDAALAQIKALMTLFTSSGVVQPPSAYTYTTVLWREVATAALGE